MPIRLKDQLTRLSRLSAVLQNSSSAFVGTHAVVQARTGTIASMLDPGVGTLAGFVSAAPARTGAIATQLDANSPAVTGFFSLASNRTGTIASTLAANTSAFGGGQGTQTALEALAASLAPGQWGVLNQGGTLNSLWNGGGAPNSSSIFEYGWRMCWDSQQKRALWYGGDDNGSGTNNPKFVMYQESTNTWSQLPNPFFRFTNSPMHSYGHNAIDVPGRRLYYHTMGYNSTVFYSIDLDNINGAWTARADINNSTWAVEGAVSFAEFPARGRVVLASCDDPSYNIREYNPTANTWNASSASSTTSGGIHLFCEYSGAFITGQAANGCVVFGGGQSSAEIRRFNVDGTITTLADWPYTGTFDCRYADIVRDPVTQNLLVLFDNGSTRVFAVLDPRGAGTWTQLASGTNSVPPFDSGWDDAHSTFHTSICSVDNHGVIMVCQWRPTNSRVMIYKHAASVTMAQLIAEADATPFTGNTLQALDFETTNHGAEAQMIFWAGQGSGVQMTNTTDADNYLRGHPNAANFIGGGFVFSGGLNFQGRYTPFVSEIHTVPETANGSAWVGPRLIAGQGEFQGYSSGSRTGLRLRTPQGTQKASGDFVIAFRRNQGVGVGTPHTFWVAGLGAEYWVRFALRHTPEYLAHMHTNFSGNAEGKRCIVSGDSTSQALEETIQEVGKNRRWAMYSDSGSEPHFESTRPYIADWTVVHIHVIMANPQNSSNGRVELFLNDETTPVGVTTTANMDAGDTLLTGWQTAVNTANNPNVGEWKLSLTNFTTEKNSSQVHAPLDNYYDNVVIRRDTRCPHIRSG